MLSQLFASWIRRLFRPTASHRGVLALEQLEARNVPSVAPNGVFVSSLYQGLLNRPADMGGLTYWTGQLNSGVSRTQVAVDIAGSNEALGHDVQQLYSTLLNRPADPTGLNYWIGQLGSGTTLDQAKAGILGSNEFFTKAGGTNQDFLDALYSHELGRPVDSTGLNYWENQLNAGVSRTTVANEVLATPEANNEKVTSIFNDVLDRAPDAAGLNYWSGQLQAGVPETQVLGGILGSNEYFAQVQNIASMPKELDPNQAAADMAGAVDPATYPLLNAEYLAHRFVNDPVVIAPAVAPSSAVSAPVVVDSGPANVLPPSAPVPPAKTTVPASSVAVSSATTTTPALPVAPAVPQLPQEQTQPNPQQEQNQVAQQGATQDGQDTVTQQAASPQQVDAAAQLAALQQQAAQAAQQAALVIQAAEAAQQTNGQQQQDEATQQDDLQQQQDQADLMGAPEPAWQQTQDQLAAIQQQEADEAAEQAAVQQQDAYDMSVLQNAQDQLQAEFAAQQDY